MSKKVWSKDDKDESDNVWDDTELIKMYEESISSTYKVPKSTVKSKKFVSSDGTTYTWKVGGKCMAPFREEEDAEIEWFPATIDRIGGKNDLEVDVTFDGYGNQETVDMKDLWIQTDDDAEEEKVEDVVMRSPKTEKTPNSRKKNGNRPSTSNESSSRNFGSPSIPVIAPPPPPGVLGMVPPSEVEALSSMLMSWYMSGYHTGYYKALSDQKNSHK